MNRVQIFDTTLRDGEQPPGVSLNAEEKLTIARQLERLGVDVIEAGFPAASSGDLAAVQAIAREVRAPVICTLARAEAGVVVEEKGRRASGQATAPDTVEAAARAYLRAVFALSHSA